jgi:hypothetical protein
MRFFLTGHHASVLERNGLANMDRGTPRQTSLPVLRTSSQRFSAIGNRRTLNILQLSSAGGDIESFASIADDLALRPGCRPCAANFRTDLQGGHRFAG